VSGLNKKKPCSTLHTPLVGRQGTVAALFETWPFYIIAICTASHRSTHVGCLIFLLFYGSLYVCTVSTLTHMRTPLASFPPSYSGYTANLPIRLEQDWGADAPVSQRLAKAYGGRAADVWVAYSQSFAPTQLIRRIVGWIPGMTFNTMHSNYIGYFDSCSYASVTTTWNHSLLALTLLYVADSVMHP
jgi:hypothetical protein